MTPESGVILGIGIALVLFIVVRRMDKRQHERKLKVLQDRIARSEASAGERQQDESETSAGER